MPAGDWMISKFDLDLNPLAAYHVSHKECDCPRGNKPTCRHRKMLRVFIDAGHVNDGWFLDYETRTWTKPIADLVEDARAEPLHLRPEPPRVNPSERPIGEELERAGLVHRLPDPIPGVEMYQFTAQPSGGEREVAPPAPAQDHPSPARGPLRIRRLPNHMRNL